MRERNEKDEPKAVIEAALVDLRKALDSGNVLGAVGLASTIESQLVRVGNLSNAIHHMGDTYEYRVEDAPGTVVLPSGDIAPDDRGIKSIHASTTVGSRMSIGEAVDQRVKLDTTTTSAPSPIGSAAYWRNKLEAREEYFRREADEHMETSGLLAAVCDALFEDDERAATKGYKGVLERAHALVHERNALIMHQQNPTVMSLLFRLQDGEHENRITAEQWRDMHDALVRLESVTRRLSGEDENLPRPVHLRDVAMTVVGEAEDAVASLGHLAPFLDPHLRISDAERLQQVRALMRGAGFDIDEPEEAGNLPPSTATERLYESSRGTIVLPAATDPSAWCQSECPMAPGNRCEHPAGHDGLHYYDGNEWMRSPHDETPTVSSVSDLPRVHAAIWVPTPVAAGGGNRQPACTEWVCRSFMAAEGNPMAEIDENEARVRSREALAGPNSEDGRPIDEVNCVDCLKFVRVHG